jgi:hypothetical protein
MLNILLHPGVKSSNYLIGERIFISMLEGLLRLIHQLSFHLRLRETRQSTWITHPRKHSKKRVRGSLQEGSHSNNSQYLIINTLHNP